MHIISLASVCVQLIESAPKPWEARIPPEIASSIPLSARGLGEDCDSLLSGPPGRGPHLPLVAQFVVTGIVWEVSTNCQQILGMLHDVFQSKANEFSSPDLKLALHVDFGLLECARPAFPYFRALEHLYYGAFGPEDSILVDQLNNRVVGSFSEAMARDVAYWKRVILPCLVGITSSCVGVAPVHCACVVKDQFGLLIHGESGSGKSTLALSLAMNGFSYLSDDCTYISPSKSGLRCWGSSAPLKLLPEGVAYFPQLAVMLPGQSLNGEVAFEVDPVEIFGVQRSFSCDPRWLFFLERTHESRAEFLPISSAEASFRLASDLEVLPQSIAHQRRHQVGLIDRLTQRGCWILRHGLQPKALVSAIDNFCSFNAEFHDPRSSQAF